MLNLLGALHGVNHGGEIDQKGVANGFDDVAVMCSRGLLQELIMDLQQAQGLASLAPIWRLKPTMSVNMIAANLRVSLAVGGCSSAMRAIMQRMRWGCQRLGGEDDRDLS